MNDRVRSADNRRAPDRAGVGIESAGNIERQDGHAAIVDRIDPLDHGGIERTRQAGPEDGIDDDFGVGETAVAPRLHDAPARDEIIVSAPCISTQLSGIAQRHHRDIDAHGLRQPRQHIAIATVVARPANDGDPLLRRPATAQRHRRRFAGLGHQRVGRYVQIVDRVAIEGPHLSGGMHGQWQMASYVNRLTKCPSAERVFCQNRTMSAAAAAP